MKRLPEKIKYHGYDYSLVLRGKKAAIYEQVVSKDMSYYEAFLIIVRQEKVINGSVIESGERWPRDEDIGSTGWTYKTLVDAKKRFYELEEGIKRNPWEKYGKEDSS